MRPILLTLCVFAAAFLSTDAQADEPPKRSSELQVLDRFIGAWDEKVTIKPTSGEEIKMDFVSRRRWTLGGTFLQIEDAHNLDDPNKREFQLLWTYDPAAKNYPAVIMDGPHRAELTGTWDAKTTTMHWTGKSSDGSTSKGYHRFIGKDRVEASGVFRDPDGNVTMEVSWPQTRRRPTANNTANTDIAKQIINSMDRNGDGKISKDEASEDLKLFFGNYDTNEDGLIDVKEALPLTKYVNGHQAESGKLR